jgi:uncharacterized integral membrane protein
MFIQIFIFLLVATISIVFSMINLQVVTVHLLFLDVTMPVAILVIGCLLLGTFIQSLVQLIRSLFYIKR